MPYEEIASKILAGAFAAPAGAPEIEEAASDIGDGRMLLTASNRVAESAMVAVTLPDESGSDEDDQDEGAGIRLLRDTWSRRVRDGVVGAMEQDGRLVQAARLDRAIDVATLARLLETLLDRGAAVAESPPSPSVPTNEDAGPGWIRI